MRSWYPSTAWPAACATLAEAGRGLCPFAPSCIGDVSTVAGNTSCTAVITLMIFSIASAWLLPVCTSNESGQGERQLPSFFSRKDRQRKGPYMRAFRRASRHRHVRAFQMSIKLLTGCCQLDDFTLHCTF